MSCRARSGGTSPDDRCRLSRDLNRPQASGKASLEVPTLRILAPGAQPLELPALEDLAAGAETPKVAGSDGGCLVGDWVDNRGLAGVAQRDMRCEGVEARLAPVAGDPGNVIMARVAAEQGGLGATRALELTKHVHEVLVQPGDLGRAFNGHAHGAGALSTSGHSKCHGRLIAQSFIEALEDDGEVASANELLRQRDMREMVSVEPQALELIRWQGPVQAYRPFRYVRWWQNGHVECKKCRHRGLPSVGVGVSRSTAPTSLGVAFRFEYRTYHDIPRTHAVCPSDRARYPGACGGPSAGRVLTVVQRA